MRVVCRAAGGASGLKRFGVLRWVSSCLAGYSEWRSTSEVWSEGANGPRHTLLPGEGAGDRSLSVPLGGEADE